MSDDILKISRMLNEDPDEIQELAVTTGAIPIAPLGGTGFASRKKRKPKKKRKYKADPVTGKAKDGEVLYSGIEDDKHIEEAESKLDKEKRARDLKFIANAIIPRKLSEVSSDLNTGAPKFKEEGLSDAAETRLEKSQSTLRAAYNQGIRVSAALRRFGTIHAQSLNKKTGDIDFAREFLHLQTVMQGTFDQAQNGWQAGGVGMYPPPSGWLGIRKYNSTEKKLYLESYIQQLVYVYFKKLGQLLEQHKMACTNSKCTANKHANWLLKGYTNSFDGELSLEKVTIGLRKERRRAAQDFQAYGRKKQKVRPQLSDADQARRAEWMRQNPGKPVPQRDIHQDYYNKMFGWEEPELKKPSLESAPFDISRYITEDPDVHNDTSL